MNVTCFAAAPSLLCFPVGLRGQYGGALLSLRLGRFHPPREIVGKAREGLLKRLTVFANGFAFG